MKTGFCSERREMLLFLTVTHQQQGHVQTSNSDCVMFNVSLGISLVLHCTSPSVHLNIATLEGGDDFHQLP